ncbi:MAG: aminoacyl-tRNA hydrolase [Lysobacterales bacterium]
MSETFLIVGLGNPGSKYSQTRHNAGFWFLDALHREVDPAAGDSRFRLQAKVSAEVCRGRVFGKDCIFAKPDVFMNHSGQAVRALKDYYKVGVEKLLVAYDDLDLPPGTARLKTGGGHGGHNGMRDIFRHLDNTDFMRLRIGIGHPGFKDAVTAYVLSRPPAEQEQQIMHSIGDAIGVMPDLLAGRVAKATKDLHTVAEPSVN